MKKIVIYLFVLMLYPLSGMAQSSMTDDQVMQFVVKEHAAGTSQSQIVTKLMQSGVDIAQIRRVRKIYDRQINSKGLGTVADEAVTKADNRMRKSNGETKKTTGSTQYYRYRLSGRTYTK
jgi:hypothetical protein